MDKNVSESATRASRLALAKEVYFLSFELTNILFWASIVIIAFRLSGLLINIFPFSPAEISWQVKASYGLMESAPVFILGILLLLLSEILNPEDQVIKRRALRARQFSYVLALIFLILIPLQPWLGLQSIRTAIASDREVLTRYSKAINWMKNSTHHYELISASTHLPTRIPMLSARLDDPFEPLKQNYVKNAEFLKKTAAEQMRARSLARREQAFFTTSRNFLLYVLSFIAFASIAKLKSLDPPLLVGMSARILHLFSSPRKRDLS